MKILVCNEVCKLRWALWQNWKFLFICCFVQSFVEVGDQIMVPM